MTTETVNELLERYFAGTTSLAEEADLRAYFTGNNVAPELAQYTPLFAYWQLAATSPAAVQPAKSRRLPIRWLSAAAASVLLLLAANIWLQPDHEQSDTSIAEVKTIDWSKYEVTDQEEALRILHGALKTASTELNRAPRAAANQLRTIRQSLD